MAKNDDLNERVNLAIREQLLALMPEDELRQKVDAEMINFFSPTKNQNYSSGYSLSPFASLVEAEMKKRVGPAIEEMFRSEKWKQTLNENGEIILGEALQSIIKFDPTLIVNWTARQAHLNMARGIVHLLAEFQNQSGNWEYASALRSFMDNELKRLEAIPT